MKRGKFITFEGLDGAGKTTQAALLAAWLRDYCKLDVLETFEPGGMPFAMQMREIILHHDDLDGMTQTLLLAAARREHIRHRIAPALAAGEWVVCDRFSDSTFAYQGGGRGVDVQWIHDVLRGVQEGLVPDMTFYLQAPPDKHSRPMASADVFETQRDDFHAAVDAGYQRQIAAANGRIKTIAWSDANERRDKQTVTEDIRKHAAALL